MHIHSDVNCTVHVTYDTDSDYLGDGMKSLIRIIYNYKYFTPNKRESRQENDDEDVCMHWSNSESATRRGTSATWRYCHIWVVAMQIPAARLRPRSATCIHDLAYRRMLDVAPQCTSYVLLFEYFVINDVIQKVVTSSLNGSSRVVVIVVDGNLKSNPRRRQNPKIDFAYKYTKSMFSFSLEEAIGAVSPLQINGNVRSGIDMNLNVG